MSQVICVHSARRGAGKSMACANIAALLGVLGQRVGVLDANFQAPSLNLMFGLTDQSAPKHLNGYLQGQYEIEDTAVDVTASLDEGLRGTVHVTRCIPSAGSVADALPDGQYTSLINDGARKLISAYKLDTLLVDTDAGLNGDTLPAVAMSDTVLLVLCHDQRDYQGTSVTVDVLHRLAVIPRTVLLLNEVPTVFDFGDVRTQVADTYQCEVAGVIPHSDQMAALGGSGIFALYYPKDPITLTLKQAAKLLITP